MASLNYDSRHIVADGAQPLRVRADELRGGANFSHERHSATWTLVTDETLIRQERAADATP